MMKKDEPTIISLHTKPVALNPVSGYLEMFDTLGEAEEALADPDHKLHLGGASGLREVKVTRLGEPRRQLHLGLEAANSCNLNCSYCFLSRMDHTKRKDQGVMSKETVQAFLDKYADPSEVKKLTITLFGGEPLLNLPLLHWLLTEVRPRYKEMPLTLTTNASNLFKPMYKYDGTISEFLVEHNIAFMVSLDGPKEVHDKGRPLYMKEGSSFDLVMKSLESLKEACPAGKLPPVRLRATYGESMFDEGSPTLTDRLKFLNSLVDQGYASSIFAAMDSGLHPKYWDQIREQHRDLTTWMIDEAKGGDYKNVGNITRSYLKPLLLRNTTTSTCGAGRGYVGLDVNGNIHPCHRIVTPIGTTEEGIRDDEYRLWSKNSHANLDTSCTVCPFRRYCGGGCRVSNAAASGGDPWQHQEVCCFLSDINIAACFRIMDELTEDQAFKLARISRSERTAALKRDAKWEAHYRGVPEQKPKPKVIHPVDTTPKAVPRTKRKPLTSTPLSGEVPSI